MCSCSLENAEIMLITARINAFELRAMTLNSTKDIKHAEGSTKISELGQEMSAEVDAVRATLGEDYSSDDYKQMLTDCESIENEYQLEIDAVNNQMERAEEQIDTQLEQIEVWLEEERSRQDEWKEARDDTVERTFSYFE